LSYESRVLLSYTFGIRIPKYNTHKNNSLYLLQVTGKGKTIPLKPWTGSDDSWRLRLPDFKTIGT
jgi:hypothetical protein